LDKEKKTAPMGQSTMDNPEKLAVYDTQTKTNKKHNMG
jgi:hypothetical protein